MLLANRPDQIVNVSTVNFGTAVEIIWEATVNSRNSDVFGYRVKIKRADGTFVEHPECDGMSTEVVQSRTCYVSMTSLLVADFYLAEGDRILATVEAMNEIDYSVPSIPQGEALV